MDGAPSYRAQSLHFALRISPVGQNSNSARHALIPHRHGRVSPPFFCQTTSARHSVGRDAKTRLRGTLAPCGLRAQTTSAFACLSLKVSADPQSLRLSRQCRPWVNLPIVSNHRLAGKSTDKSVRQHIFMSAVTPHGIQLK
ncbi:hypothetical protein LY76DRAFT_353805 [Colletotrichum caudatum]|nr:hypothetical protein LY76DRAFT_353805 [Colletotrichum caudatum]